MVWYLAVRTWKSPSSRIGKGDKKSNGIWGLERGCYRWGWNFIRRSSCWSWNGSPQKVNNPIVPFFNNFILAKVSLFILMCYDMNRSIRSDMQYEIWIEFCSKLNRCDVLNMTSKFFVCILSSFCDCMVVFLQVWSWPL